MAHQQLDSWWEFVLLLSRRPLNLVDQSIQVDLEIIVRIISCSIFYVRLTLDEQLNGMSVASFSIVDSASVVAAVLTGQLTEGQAGCFVSSENTVTWALVQWQCIFQPLKVEGWWTWFNCARDSHPAADLHIRWKLKLHDLRRSWINRLILVADELTHWYLQLKINEGKTKRDIKSTERYIFSILAEMMSTRSYSGTETTNSRERLILTEVNRMDKVAGKTSSCNL